MRGLFAVTKETFVGNGSGSLGGKDGHRGALSREAHRMESGRDSNMLRYGFALQRESIRGHLMGVDKPIRGPPFFLLCHLLVPRSAGLGWLRSDSPAGCVLRWGMQLMECTASPNVFKIHCRSAVAGTL